MSTPADVFIGIDLGTSSLKGVAMSGDGAIVASASAGYVTSRPSAGRAEQDPADWWNALGAVVAELLGGVAAARWAGIGLSGMLPTLVLTDEAGEPVGPAITWEDDRAEADGDAYRAAAGPDALYRETGQWVDGRYLLPMVRWLSREAPERVRRASRILGAKDHLFARLTGVPVTDPSTAAGFGCYALARGGWNKELAAPWAEWLPAVVPSTETRSIDPHVAEALGLAAGLRVAVGAADSVCGALAVGAGSVGRASLWGTSTAIIGIHDELRFDADHRYLVTPLALRQRWGLEMDLVSTGSAIAWLAGVLGVSEGDVFSLAVASPFGAHGATVLPFLGPGEQGARWDPTLRGTIGGLTLTHGREDLARALLEGIALEVRRCTRVLDEAGVPPGPLVMAGGAAGSPMFAAMVAGATGAPVVSIDDGRWASALGAAIVAAASLDAVDIDPSHSMPRHVIEPDESDWGGLAAGHEDLLKRLG